MNGVHRSPGRRGANCWAMLALAACFGAPPIEPAPFAGPAPRAIAVWPWPELASAAEPWLAAERAVAAQQLLAGLDSALVARGYRVQASAVVRELLDEAEPPPDASPWAAAGRVLAVDAVLRLEVRQFAVQQSRSGWLQEAQWDLQWRVVATADGATLWSHEYRGAFRRADLEPDRSYRPDDLREPQSFGPRPPSFRTTEELLRHLHWQALQHLPAAPPSP